MVIAVDYDQIELRFIGMYAEDPTMQEIFRSGVDVHAGTAAAVIGVDISDVDSEQRNRYGKMPNFMLGYGGTAYGLAGKLNIPVEHAEKVLNDYYKAFARIRPWKTRELRRRRDRASTARVNGDAPADRPAVRGDPARAPASAAAPADQPAGRTGQGDLEEAQRHAQRTPSARRSTPSSRAPPRT